MTREQQLAFCKTCTNRKMDLQQGLLCSLTGAKADFTSNCADYNEDASAKASVSETELYQPNELSTKISDAVYEKLKIEQNLGLAILTGIIAGLIGAVLWGMITVSTGYQIGYMAIAIGAGVGFTMRYFGKGMDQIFGIMGGLIAVLSCFIGNFFSIIGFFANSEGLNYIDTLIGFDYAYFMPLMEETFSFIDIVFYGIAGYEGYKFSFRTFSEQEVESLRQS